VISNGLSLSRVLEAVLTKFNEENDPIPQNSRLRCKKRFSQNVVLVDSVEA
jgi:hypothetical protein